ncbi:phage protein, HK97 gp10 family [Nitrosomonas ureae]|uniref:Phage protein, HK97 gp10 family n=1 Tax=Nitrosomonas ureae TaxID=44577 RepID=A0A285BXW2_9PROT|nr:HK97-gp10 family putative phage morphogenesis protein [Nitrosomonas ureae]SNX59728.1 phage protein, HK97 gp10 family [Nitrosomonas ureae]
MAGKTIITGGDKLLGKFLELRQEMVHKTSRRMAATGGGVLRKEAKAIAQSHGFNKSGALIRNIAIKRESRVPQGVEQYHLGVRHGKDLTKSAMKKSKLVLRKGSIRYVDDPYYWSFLEFGWIPRGPGEALRGGTGKKQAIRNAQSARRIPGRSFIGQALVNKKQEAIAAMEDRLVKDLAKYNNP